VVQTSGASLVLDAQGKAYDRINNFKARVLDYAVQQINQLTDIEI